MTDAIEADVEAVAAAMLDTIRPDDCGAGPATQRAVDTFSLIEGALLDERRGLARLAIKVLRERGWKPCTNENTERLANASPTMHAALTAIKDAAADLAKCKSAIPRNRYIADIVKWADHALEATKGAHVMTAHSPNLHIRPVPDEGEAVARLPHIPPDIACALVNYICERAEMYGALRRTAERKGLDDAALGHLSAQRALMQLSVAIGHASREPAPTFETVVG